MTTRLPVVPALGVKPEDDPLYQDFLAALAAEEAADKVATVSPVASTIPATPKILAPLGFPAVLALAGQAHRPVDQAPPFATPCQTTTITETPHGGATDEDDDNSEAQDAAKSRARHLARILARSYRHLLPSRQRRPVLPARWRDHTSTQKLHRAGEALTLRYGMAWTLNIAPARQDTLRQHPDPARLLSGYVLRELKRAGLDHLGFGFAFDVSDDHKLHVHGLIERPADDALPALKDALRRAGGRVPANQLARVLSVSPINAGWGWVTYATKALTAVAAYLGRETAPFMSRKLTTIAQTHTARVRAIAEAGKAIPASTPTRATADARPEAAAGALGAPVNTTTTTTTTTTRRASLRVAQAVTRVITALIRAAVWSVIPPWTLPVRPLAARLGQPP